jgi:hypothetical protein
MIPAACVLIMLQQQQQQQGCCSSVQQQCAVLKLRCTKAHRNAYRRLQHFYLHV